MGQILKSTCGQTVDANDVAEWVGLHYVKNFSAEGHRQQEWIDRYVEMRQEAASGTKLVRVLLAALVRLEYTEIVEVPVGISDAELQELVDLRYFAVDGGDYLMDNTVWQRGQCYAKDVRDEGVAPSLVAWQTEDGLHIERASARSSGVASGSGSMAWEVTQGDVLAVLQQHWAEVTNTQGKPFNVLAGELLPRLNTPDIERAALHGGLMDANEEILRQLRLMGVL